MTCQRCAGFLSVGYDEIERCEFVRCLNCGARPAQKVKRVDGCRIDEPLRCITCKVQPREVMREAWGRVSMKEVKRCKECRIAYNARKTMLKRHTAQRRLKEAS